MKLTSILFESFNLKKFIASEPRLVGYGFSRNVYDYDNETVIKVAKKSKDNDGRKSNKNEVNNYECLTAKYAAQIYDYDKSTKGQLIGPEWILMEKASNKHSRILEKLIELVPIKEYTLKKLEYNVDNVLTYFSYALDALVNNKTSIDIEKSNIMMKDFSGEWIDGLISKLKSCGVDAYDLHKGNWGIRESTGELIMIDYGEGKFK